MMRSITTVSTLALLAATPIQQSHADFSELELSILKDVYRRTFGKYPRNLGVVGRSIVSDPH